MKKRNFHFFIIALILMVGIIFFLIPPQSGLSSIDLDQFNDNIELKEAVTIFCSPDYSSSDPPYYGSAYNIAEKYGGQNGLLSRIAELDSNRALKIFVAGAQEKTSIFENFTWNWKAWPKIISSFFIYDETFDDKLPVRRAAIEGLALINDIRASKELIEIYKNEKNTFLREIILLILGKKQHEISFHFLVKELSHNSSSSIRARSAYALDYYGDKKAIPYLLKSLDDKSEDVRKAAISSLASLNEKIARPYLIKALNDEAPSVRETVAYIIGNLKQEEYIEPLIAALKKEKEPDTQIVILNALECYNDERINNAILWVLSTNNEVETCNRAAEILGNFSINRLILALNTADTPQVRASIAYGLRKSENQKAIEPLNELLHDEDSSVKYQAALGLAHLGDKRSISPLLELVKSIEFTTEDVNYFCKIEEELTILISKIDDPELKKSLGKILFLKNDILYRQHSFLKAQNRKIPLSPEVQKHNREMLDANIEQFNAWVNYASNLIKGIPSESPSGSQYEKH